MNAENRLKACVANIQDELQQILAVAAVKKLENPVPNDKFKSLLVSEFNSKLRKYKANLRSLTAENERLKEEVKRLATELDRRSHGPLHAKPSKSESALTNIPYMAPPKRRRTDSAVEADEEEVFILSSPLKGKGSPGKRGDLDRSTITSSQFNRLPTQYSDSSEGARAAGPGEDLPTRDEKLRLSPVKASFAGGSNDDDDRVVADSQDEVEPLAGFGGRPSYPKHYTALQRAEFLRNYYRAQLAKDGFVVSLAANPITDAPWRSEDFKPNPLWVGARRLNSHLGVMTKAQEKEYAAFFAAAGTGVSARGPKWDHDDTGGRETGRSPWGGEGEREGERRGSERGEGDHEWVRSQVMDKYLLPPGYMTGDFATTQEAADRRQEVAAKERERVVRRLQSALSRRGEFVFYEEVLNSYVAQGRYEAGTKGAGAE